MKRFFLISVGMLIGAVVATVVVWYFLQDSLPSQVADAVPAAPETTTPDTTEDETSAASQTPLAEPIPLRDLPLSDAQRSAIEAVGIDVETFVIMPDMAACARDTLGSARFDEILSGSAPTFIESTRLLGCMR